MKLTWKNKNYQGGEMCIVGTRIPVGEVMRLSGGTSDIADLLNKRFEGLGITEWELERIKEEYREEMSGTKSGEVV